MTKAIFITVRTDSTRLPKKALLKINNIYTIEHLIYRVKKSKLADKIVLCTTNLKSDDILCKIAKKNQILFYRGSVSDKLKRWKNATKEFDIDFFVTADGDDIFCDPILIDLAFNQFQKSGNTVDFIKSDKIVCGAFTYGIKTTALEKVCDIKNTNDTEMMWVYFTETGIFDVQELSNVNKSFFRNDVRMTLDYKEDLDFFSTIINHFDGRDYDLKDILAFIDKNPEVKKINFHLQEKWTQNQKNKTKLLIK